MAKKKSPRKKAKKTVGVRARKTPRKPKANGATLKLPVGFENSFEALLQAVPDPTYLKDTEGRNIAFNAAFAELLGTSAKNIIGKRDQDLMSSDLANACRSSDQAVMRAGKPQVSEERGSDGSGKDVLFSTVKAPIKDGGGKVTGVVGVSRNVTAERLTAGELRDARERLAIVINDAPLILFAVNPKGFITLCEGQGLEALGLKPGQTVGEEVNKLYEHNPKGLAGINSALEGRATVDVIEEEGRFLQIHFIPHRDEAGQLSGMVGFSLDVTERMVAAKEREHQLAREKILREEAEAANRAKDEFLALLSHELRTPMTAMMGWTWLLRSRDLDGAEYKLALESIERNMKSQAQIIEDLLDISRVVTGKMRVESRTIELAPVLCSAVDVIRPAAVARRISIDLEPLLPASRVKGDAERLQQAFWNVLNNAVKFTPTGGKVTIRFRESSHSVGISFADSGVGMSAEALERAFDPFAQAEKSLTRQHGGLGLGLAIVRHIVQAHGGSVEASSAGTGKGSEFQILLPLYAEKAEKTETAHVSTPPKRRSLGDLPRLSGLHVLIVDDDTDTLAVLQVVLEHCGAQVTAAATASEAFAAVVRLRPDAIVSDLAMPGEDGYSLIRRVRDLPDDAGGKIPAAALTARTHTEDRTRVLMAGFQMYLPKPIEPAELAAVVVALCGRKT